MISDPIARLDIFIYSDKRDQPYLGPLADGEEINERGYVVRKGNGTIYPTIDRSVVVKLTTDSGIEGWGETYGICAPKATCEIIADLIAPVVKGKEPEQVEKIWQENYDMMRVRGFFSGFYLDALAAIDIALWDIRGKLHQKPVHQLLGEERNTIIPAYISGLPANSIAEKIEIAKHWQQRGFSQFKIAAAVSHDGIYEELAALRKALGADAELMVDLHWKYDEQEALDLLNKIVELNLAFAEAPLKPENVSGLTSLSKLSPIRLAGGEEWYTEYQARERIEPGAVKIVQPEMGHTGITQFVRIGKLAAQKECLLAPHATIGLGIFMAASLQASASLPNVWIHEFQHSVFEKNLQYIETDMQCENGFYHLPNGAGLGIAPNEKIWDKLEPYSSQASF